MSLFSIIVVLATLGTVSAVTCGRGTEYDPVDDACVASALKFRRSVDGARIRTENGNVLIETSGDGKQVGYRVGNADPVYFDELEDSLTCNTAAVVPALSLGYTLGGGNKEVLDYLKDNLSGRVDGVDSRLTSLNTDVTNSVSEAVAAIDAKANTLEETVNATLLSAMDDTNSALHEIGTSLDAKMDDLRKQLNLLQKEQLCGNGYSYDETKSKCFLDVGTQSSPAETCMDVYRRTFNNLPADGFYWVKPGTSAAFQVYCTFQGEYAGAGLMLRRPGSVSGMEGFTNARGGLCDPRGGSDKKKYCKLTDKLINEYKAKSEQRDAYIILVYRADNAKVNCKNFVNKACTWAQSGPARTSCENNPGIRNHSPYCPKDQTTSSYRAVDGHRCSYNSNVAVDAKYPGNPFMIFEHSGGGSLYCGGWDTTWNKAEVWVN